MERPTALVVQIEHGGIVLTSHGPAVDCAIWVDPEASTRRGSGAFGLPRTTAAPVVVGSWIGSVSSGASVNCPAVSLVAHSAGTHTECVGHATLRTVTLRDILPAHLLFPAVLVTVEPTRLNARDDDLYVGSQPGDAVVTRSLLSTALERCAQDVGIGHDKWKALLRGGAVAVRTRKWQDTNMAAYDWSGTNPPYLTPSAVALLCDAGVEHLLVDLPSLDREYDGGKLQTHRRWWGLPPKRPDGHDATDPWSTRTATEMLAVPDACGDGLYILNLNVAPIALDAAPSRPLLYPAATLRQPRVTFALAQ